jgi:hypothetical protein
VSSALAGALPPDAASRIIDLMLQSTATIALRLEGNPTKDAQAALKFCRDAEATAARYDRAPFYDGYIAECLGLAEQQLKQKKAACAHYSRAVQSYRTVPAADRNYSNAAKFLLRAQKSYSGFGC